MSYTTIYARLRAIAHQYPIHIGCGGECTPHSTYRRWCHGCDNPVPRSEIAYAHDLSAAEAAVVLEMLEGKAP